MRKPLAAVTTLTVIAAPALAFAVLAGPAASVQAGDLCQDVATGGSVLVNSDNERCIPYKNAAICDTQAVNVFGEAIVSVTGCVPAP
jgi:hypothetical protein